MESGNCSQDMVYGSTPDGESGWAGSTPAVQAKKACEDPRQPASGHHKPAKREARGAGERRSLDSSSFDRHCEKTSRNWRKKRFLQIATECNGPLDDRAFERVVVEFRRSVDELERSQGRMVTKAHCKALRMMAYAILRKFNDTARAYNDLLRGGAGARSLASAGPMFGGMDFASEPVKVATLVFDSNGDCIDFSGGRRR